jgi:hypothetical protein
MIKVRPATQIYIGVSIICTILGVMASIVFGKEFLITFFSVVAGGLLSFFIVLWQLGNESQARDHEEKDIADFFVDRIYLELLYNLGYLSKIQDALGLVTNPNKEHWQWLATLSDSFIFNSHNALMQTGFQKHLPQKVEAGIYSSCLNLQYTTNLINTKYSQLKFPGVSQGASAPLSNKKASVPIVNLCGENKSRPCPPCPPWFI